MYPSLRPSFRPCLRGRGTSGPDEQTPHTSHHGRGGPSGVLADSTVDTLRPSPHKGLNDSDLSLSPGSYTDDLRSGPNKATLGRLQKTLCLYIFLEGTFSLGPDPTRQDRTPSHRPILRVRRGPSGPVRVTRVWDTDACDATWPRRPWVSKSEVTDLVLGIPPAHTETHVLLLHSSDGCKGRSEDESTHETLPESEVYTHAEGSSSARSQLSPRTRRHPRVAPPTAPGVTRLR